MTRVFCACFDCINNENGECTKDEIHLDERDEQWKDCDSAKVNN